MNYCWKTYRFAVGINVNISSSKKLWFLLGIQGHLVVLHLILRACLVSIILGLTQTLSSIKLVIEIKIILLDAMDCQGCVWLYRKLTPQTNSFINSFENTFAQLLVCGNNVVLIIVHYRLRRALSYTWRNTIL